MVLGGIRERHRTPLVVVAGNLTGIRYRHDIVQRYVIPFIQAQTNNVIFQQNNARPHVAHVWDEMERRLCNLLNQPVTLAEMDPAVMRIWKNIPQAFFNTLNRSMRRRCQSCINANGRHTRY